jgi:uncharacterized membrane protein YoaK (UPF0700 family)
MPGPPPSTTESTALLASLCCLTFTTGLVDAASVLGLGHVFTANMTGNIVFLAFALEGAGRLSLLAAVVSLAGFVTGATVGGRLGRTLSARRVLGCELVLLVVAASVAAFDVERALPRGVVIAVLAAGMGMQNAAVRKLAVPDMTTTVLTLTLTGLAADSSLAGGDNPRWRRRLLSVGLMCGGALAGAGLLRLGVGVVVVIGAAALVAGVALVLHPRAPGGASSRR